jgi:AraC family ethanolamine operon transcriptional activator
MHRVEPDPAGFFAQECTTMNLSSPTTAAFRVKHASDAFEHAHHLDAWDQRYEQTSSGVFQGEVHELVDGSFQVFHEVANRATAQRCAPWPGGLWVGLSAPDTDTGLRYMGRPTGPHQLMLATGHEPFDLQVPAGHGLYGLVVAHGVLEEHMQRLHRQPLPAHPGPAARSASSPQVQSITPLQRMRLAGMLREVLKGLATNPQALSHVASRHTLQQAVLTVLADTLMPQSLKEAATPRQMLRHDLVSRTRDWVMAAPDQPRSVADLCAHLHVTRRTLQNSFLDTLGQSPAQFLRQVRLNAVRRALREPGEAAIADVAARWGFWHMGHFSQAYKALFGETPSQTRQGR